MKYNALTLYGGHTVSRSFHWWMGSRNHVFTRSMDVIWAPWRLVSICSVSSHPSRLWQRIGLGLLHHMQWFCFEATLREHMHGLKQWRQYEFGSESTSTREIGPNDVVVGYSTPPSSTYVAFCIQWSGWNIWNIACRVASWISNLH